MFPPLIHISCAGGYVRIRCPVRSVDSLYRLIVRSAGLDNMLAAFWSEWTNHARLWSAGRPMLLSKSVVRCSRKLFAILPLLLVLIHHSPKGRLFSFPVPVPGL